MGERADEMKPPGEVEELRAEIEQTRSEMSETIDAIQAKLDPQHLKEQAKDAVREATLGRAQRLAHTAHEKISHVVEPAAEAAGHAAHSASDKARSAARCIQERCPAALNAIRRNPVPAALIVLGVAASVGWWVWQQGSAPKRRRRWI